MKIQLDNNVYDVDISRPIDEFMADTGLNDEKATFLYEIADSIDN